METLEPNSENKDKTLMNFLLYFSGLNNLNQAIQRLTISL